ncbi:heme ABC exporter ATP-binding protein CcmA [Alphaproteobacteria bacterium]|nr:heme ABC exporter ATP-binding protein CcmA [Alphaproteobacteria bacterium]
MTNNDDNQTARKPAPSTADNCLHINQLSVLRGMVLVISNLSHQQVAGDICCLTGPNGAGKSTLLRTIAGRLPATGGDINCAVPIIYVGHTDGLSGAISGRENLAGWAKINGILATETSIDTALSSFATNRFANLPVRVLSRGQRRRLALARLALAPADTLWLLDEPNAGLDQASSRILDEIVQKHATAGGMVLAATHLDFAAAAKPRSLHLPGLVT